MEHKRQVGASGLDHLFGPKDSASSSSSSSSGIFGSIFSPPPTVPGRDSRIMGNYQVRSGNYGNPGFFSDNINQCSKGESGSISSKDKISDYQHETVEPCYFSSSIFYGGQENYSPRTKNSESHNTFKKDGGVDDPNGNNSNGASRGNWWQGSLYY